MEEKTYVQQLEEKLTAARNRVKQGNEARQLKASAPTLFEIIDTEISLAVNRAFSDTPLSYEEYLSAHGEAKGIRRIRNLIDSKAIEANQSQIEVDAIQDNLKQLKNDQQA